MVEVRALRGMQANPLDAYSGVTEMTLRGFGFTLDLETGRMRQWYCGADGVKRWADNDKPVGEGDGRG